MIVLIVAQGLTVPKYMFQPDLPRWHALSLRAVEGVGILSFPSMAEMQSKFVESESPAKVSEGVVISWWLFKLGILICGMFLTSEPDVASSSK